MRKRTETAVNPPASSPDARKLQIAKALAALAKRERVRLASYNQVETSALTEMRDKCRMLAELAKASDAFGTSSISALACNLQLLEELSESHNVPVSRLIELALEDLPGVGLITGHMPGGKPLRETDYFARVQLRAVASEYALREKAIDALGSTVLAVGTTLDRMKAAHESEDALWQAERAVLTPLAKKGESFKPGKPKGALSPLARAIQKYLARSHAATADKVWMALTKKTPRGLAFFDSPRLGRYVEDSKTGQHIASFRAFQNHVSRLRPRKKAE
jgi:hypothetical protein